MLLKATNCLFVSAINGFLSMKEKKTKLVVKDFKIIPELKIEKKMKNACFPKKSSVKIWN